MSKYTPHIENGKVIWVDQLFQKEHEQVLIVDPNKVREFCAKQNQSYKGIKPYTNANGGYMNNGDLLVSKVNEENVQMLNYFAHNGEILPEIFEQIKLI